MLEFTSLKDGSKLKFDRLPEAAGYFAKTKAASSFSAAMKNILCVLNGRQTTGATLDHKENRYSAYGYSLEWDHI